MTERGAPRPTGRAAPMLTRRAALGAGAAVAVVGFAPGGAGAKNPATSEPLVDEDAIALADLVETERGLIAAYGMAARRGQLDRPTATLLKRQEEHHLVALLPAFQGRRLQPPRKPRPELLELLRATRPRAAFLDLLAELERKAVGAYRDGLKRLTDPALVRLAGSIMASEAQHLVVLRLKAGEQPLPAPFERGER